MKKSLPLFLSIATSAVFIGQGIAAPEVHTPEYPKANTAVKNFTKVADLAVKKGKIHSNTSTDVTSTHPVHQTQVENRDTLKGAIYDKAATTTANTTTVE